MTKPHIAVLMMVKNEHKRLQVTLDSVKDFANSLVIYDTGSTDDTVDICKTFSTEHSIPLKLLVGEFVNFSTSRNVALDFADTFSEIDYILMLDTNDELRNGDGLRKFAEHNTESAPSAFLTLQEWWSGASNTYYNTRFIKPRTGWRYCGVVHEYLKNINRPDNDGDNDSKYLGKVPQDVVIYQDRTQDDDKTGKRFKRDIILLSEEYKKDSTEPRTVFYLAQTYSCLDDKENAYLFYKIRTTLIGFYEERFHACLKCGELSLALGLDWYDSFAWFMKAFMLIERVEPLIQIGSYYRDMKRWALAYMYYDLACKLSFPNQCILFVDKMAYSYWRWHLIASVAHDAGYWNEGHQAAKIALEYSSANSLRSCEADEKNMVIYEVHARRTQQTSSQQALGQQIQQQPNITKAQFLARTVTELKTKEKLTTKQAENKAKLLWKSRGT